MGMNYRSPDGCADFDLQFQMEVVRFLLCYVAFTSFHAVGCSYHDTRPGSHMRMLPLTSNTLILPHHPFHHRFLVTNAHNANGRVLDFTENEEGVEVKTVPQDDSVSDALPASGTAIQLYDIIQASYFIHIYEIQDGVHDVARREPFLQYLLDILHRNISSLPSHLSYAWTAQGRR